MADFHFNFDDWIIIDMKMKLDEKYEGDGGGGSSGTRSKVQHHTA